MFAAFFVKAFESGNFLKDPYFTDIMQETSCPKWRLAAVASCL
jgi:hypothetical protein